MHELPNLPPDCRTIVFVGPTLRHSEVRELIPDAVIFPPVRFGDIYGLIASGIEKIVIVDGLFHGDPPVWQREIALALARGISVIGAASMGALRALELAPYGMVGVGKIVRWYREGKIEGDDEVACLHAGEELDYMLLSLPLVDVRALLASSVSNGEIEASLADVIIRELKRCSHVERTRDTIVEIACAGGADQGTRSFLSKQFAPGYPSLKADDARAALAFCRNSEHLVTTDNSCDSGGFLRFDPSLPVMEATLMRAAFLQDGRRVRIRDLVQLAGQSAADCERRIRESGRRWFLQDWCSMTGLGPDQAEQRSYADNWLTERCSGNPDCWLKANAMHRSELLNLVSGYCVEAYITRSTPEQLGLEKLCGDQATVDQVLHDWMKRMRVLPPNDVGRKATAVSQWLQDLTPACFGSVDWYREQALIESLQVDGCIARLAEQVTGDGGVRGS